MPKVMAPISRMPAIQPMRAADFLMVPGIQPNRKSPSMPPEKMEDSFHQASMILSTLSMAMATIIPMRPITQLAILNTNTCWWSAES